MSFEWSESLRLQSGSGTAHYFQAMSHLLTSTRALHAAHTIDIIVVTPISRVTG